MKTPPLYEALCDICQKQNDIIRAQAEALSQMGVIAMEEEIAGVYQALTEMLGYPEGDGFA